MPTNTRHRKWIWKTVINSESLGMKMRRRRKRWKRERDGISNDSDGECWRFLVRGGNSCQTKGTTVKRELFGSVRSLTSIQLLQHRGAWHWQFS